MSRIPIRLPGPKSKYRAVRTEGYASKKEAKRAGELELLEKLGKIIGLEKQTVYTLVPKDEMGPAVTYRCDFCYWDCDTKKLIVEDVKGFKTQLYRLKRRLMWATQGIKVVEV